MADAGPTPFSYVDLSEVPDTELRATLQAHADRLQTGLSLARGPLINIGQFRLGRGRPDHLLIAIHHAVVDTVSLMIIVEDLETVCRQLQAGEAIRLPQKTTSFKEWSGRLASYADSDAALAQREYWMRLAGAVPAPLPVDRAPDGTVGRLADGGFVRSSWIGTRRRP